MTHSRKMKEGERPLISILMMTYNQETYVRDTVRGLLMQTYEPLEIIISDDCSTDGTWPIVQEEVIRYRESGGRHKVVLNRNEHNMGIGLHSQAVTKLAQGHFLVGNGGDDISFPNRVEWIYDAWVKDGGNASVIVNNAIKIDLAGIPLGEMPNRILDAGVFGAGATYSRNVIDCFDAICEPMAYEDQVYYRRARVFGDLLVIHEPLMYYRVGSGVSTARRNFRRQMVKCLKCEAASWRQTIRDLHHVRTDSTNEHLGTLNDEAKYNYCATKKQLLLWDGSTFSARMRGLCAMPIRKKLSRSGIIGIILLLPRRVSEKLLDGVIAMHAWVTALIWRMTHRRQLLQER